MRRVVVIGAECTGKTVLAEALGRVLHAPVVPEAARLFVEREGRAIRAGDEDAVARLHLELAGRAEAWASRHGSPFVVHDTDLLSTVLYARHYQGGCPSWILRGARARAPELYVVTDVDVPWEDEPGQRGTPADQDAVHRMVLEALRRRRIPWGMVSGDRERRLEQARVLLRSIG